MARLLRRLWALEGEPLDVVAAEVGSTPEGLPDLLAELADIGVVTLDDGRLHLTPPRHALAALLESESARLETAIQRLLRMGGLVTRLGNEGAVRPRVADDGTGLTMDAEVIAGRPSVDLLRRWIAEGEGDLRFLRPVEWRLPSEVHVAQAFADAVAAGREVRCVYPMEALRLARSTLENHVALGEQVRLLPQVPFQMALLGSEHALLCSGLGGETRTVMLRDPALVRVFVHHFDLVWERAIPMLEDGLDREDERRLLLQELADGVRDEQIARSLGLGLRTVRRRVADLMVELGVETRFQAGVEAVRRGWL